MADLSTLTFVQLLDSADLVSYHTRLLREGFDDVDSLCDMTEDDVTKLGIASDHRISLERLLARVRSTRTASAAGELVSRPNDPGAIDVALDRTALQETVSEPSAISQVGSHHPLQAASTPRGSGMPGPTSAWTTLTTSASFVQRLLDLYFCWEYPIFASLSKEHFLEDFSEGRSQYCSSVLVNALLALGCCFSSRQITSSVQDTQPSGDQFFDESLRLLQDDQHHHSLTTVQALGILSLRESSRGRDSQSRHYSGQSLRLAVEMGLHHISNDAADDESVVKAATFWGAFSLNNAWALISNSLPTCSSNIGPLLPSKPPVSPDVEGSLWVHVADDDATPGGLHQQTSHVRSVSRCFCELSELVHDALYALYSPLKPPQSRDILEMYAQYLSWYDLIPEILRLGPNSTPAVLFAHVYYHFAILQLFQPFTTFRIPESHIDPREVCYQAANAISVVLRSYSQLYTFRRTPSFTPHVILTLFTMHFSLFNSLSRGQPYPNLQPSSFLLYQINSLINQHIVSLAEIAPCHYSAKRALYIIGVLAKKEGLMLNCQAIDTLLSMEENILRPGMSSLGAASDMFEDELMRAWHSDTGKFVNIALGTIVSEQGPENPPFWLIQEQGCLMALNRAMVEDNGFIFLEDTG